jgi:hypothetical protein
VEGEALVPIEPATTRTATSSGKRGVPGGRVLARSRPSTPSSMNRECQRQTAVLLTPAVPMISTVPMPSAVASTIRAPHMLPQTVAVIDDRLQALAIGQAQVDGNGSTHSPDLHNATPRGVPARTLMSRSIH